MYEWLHFLPQRIKSNLFEKKFFTPQALFEKKFKKLKKWSLLTLYGLFSKNKKQIAFSLFSGGRGGPKWGQDGVWGLVSRRRTTPNPIETPFGPPQPPEYRENKIEFFLFWEKTYNVNTNLSLSWAYFSNFTVHTIPIYRTRTFLNQICSLFTDILHIKRPK